MLTLDQFKQIFKHIEDLDKKNDELTKILVCKDTTGWISYSDELVNDIFNLLNSIFDLDPDDDIFMWYLYDISDGHKYCYDDDYKYDLNNIEDLYYYVCKDFDKVTKYKLDKKDKKEKMYNYEPSKDLKDVMDIIEKEWFGDKNDK